MGHGGLILPTILFSHRTWNTVALPFTVSMCEGMCLCTCRSPRTLGVLSCYLPASSHLELGWKPPSCLCPQSTGVIDASLQPRPAFYGGSWVQTPAATLYSKGSYSLSHFSSLKLSSSKVYNDVSGAREDWIARFVVLKAFLMETACNF